MALKKIKWGLDHSQPDLFTRSQWDQGPKPSLLYVLYRVVAALIVVGLVTASGALGMGNGRWLAFLTNQGGLLLALHSLLEGWLVVSTYRATSPPPTLTTMHKMTWAVQITAWCTAIQVSLGYWLAVHPTLVSRGLVNSAKDLLIFAMPGHTLNSLACIFDSFVSARPASIGHFWLPCLFGVFYLMVNLGYWATGGLGLCKIHCVTPGSNLNVTNYSFDRLTGVPMVVQSCDQPPPCDVLVCEDYLYPTMDWSCNPGVAVALTCALFAALPLVQVFWWAVYKLRLKIASSVKPAQDQQSHSHQLEDVET